MVWGCKEEEEDKNNPTKCFNTTQCDNQMQKLDEKRHLGQPSGRAVEELEEHRTFTGEERKQEERFCCLCGAQGRDDVIAPTKN